MKKILFCLFILFALCSLSYAGTNTSVDVGRDTKAMLASFTSTTTVETSVNFQVSTNSGSLSTAASSYTVTTGKSFRVQAISGACRGGGTPATSTATLKFKVNGIQQGQPYQVACPTTTTASAASFPSLPINIPDGVEYRAGSIITFTLTLTAWSASNTPILDLGLYGYEY